LSRGNPHACPGLPKTRYRAGCQALTTMIPP